MKVPCMFVRKLLRLENPVKIAMSQWTCNLVNHDQSWLGGLLTFEYANLLFFKKFQVCMMADMQH